MLQQQAQRSSFESMVDAETDAIVSDVVIGDAGSPTSGSTSGASGGTLNFVDALFVGGN